MSVQFESIAAIDRAKSVLIVSSDPRPLVAMLKGALGALQTVSAASASEARSTAASRKFSSVLVDLRHGDAALALAVPLLAETRTTSNLCVIASHAIAPSIASVPGVSHVIVAPFSTDTLISSLDLDEAGGATFRMAPADPFEDQASEYHDGALRTLFFPVMPGGLSLPENAIPVDAIVSQPDVIVLTQRNCARRLLASLPRSISAIVPIIDATGTNQSIAEVSLQTLTRESLAEAFVKVRTIVENIRSFPPDIFLSERDEDILLARLIARGRSIEPAYDISKSKVIASKDAHVLPNMFAAADKLAGMGALHRKFFDKINCCPDCASARVLLREECRKCRSSDIEEVSLVHHFRCGYQAPERDFVKGRELTCPKCMFTLEAFSVDYDRPGSLMICSACNNETGEAAVGFKCVDCGSNHDTAKLKPRIHYRYELAENAELMLSARCRKPMTTTMPQAGDGNSTAQAMAAMEEKGLAYCGILIRVDKSGAIRGEHGERALRVSLHLIERAILEALALEAKIQRFETGLLLLVEFGDAEKLRAEMPEVIAFATSMIALPVSLEFDVLNAPQLLQLLVDPKAQDIWSTTQ